MTVQKVIAISVDEIIGMRFKCRQCGVTISVPISAQGRIPSECFSCGNSWVAADNRPELHQKFFFAIGGLAQAVKDIASGKKNTQCDFSLEVKPEIKESDA